jgi:thioredoxin 1
MKPEVKRFGAQMQSTLIVFKGSTEQGRSVGDTKETSIAALLDKSL